MQWFEVFVSLGFGLKVCFGCGCKGVYMQWRSEGSVVSNASGLGGLWLGETALIVGSAVAVVIVVIVGSSVVASSSAAALSSSSLALVAPPSSSVS